jgi:hypothetical protein
MISFRPFPIVAASLIFSAIGYAAPPAAQNVADTSAVAEATATALDDSSAAMARMDERIKLMQEMHVKFSEAKTPAERNALRVAHMKTMQDSMEMMSTMMANDKMPAMRGMRGMGMSGNSMATMRADMPMHQAMMEKRMQMMHSMMQLLIDAAPAPDNE